MKYIVHPGWMGNYDFNYRQLTSYEEELTKIINKIIYVIMISIFSL